MADRALQGVYDGHCNICGAKGRFEGIVRGNREHFPCPTCHATLRYRDQAAAILSHFADGRETFLDRFLRSEKARGLAVLEAAIRGPFVRRFRSLPGYTQCYLFDDLPAGESKDGVACQDLERTTFADESFDLVVTSDVMEHVADPRRVIREIARILRPGGAHVFSIPVRWPIAPSTVQRARLVDGAVEHLVEPRYHRSGTDAPCLVFFDYGADLIDWHRAAGLRARFFNSHLLLDGLECSPSVLAVKPGRRTVEPEAVPRPGVLAARCPVCGQRDVPLPAGEADVECQGCGAGLRTMHLAAMVVSEASGGVAPTLDRLIGSGALRSECVLDLTGDDLLAGRLRGHGGYRDSPWLGGADPGARLVDRMREAEDRSADLVLLRDGLGLVSDLAVLLDHVARIVRPGGAVIFQDAYPWPFPESTVDLAPGRFLPLGRGRRAPVHRELGADLLDQLRARGFLPTVDRPALPLDPYYRVMAIVARLV